MAQAGPSGEEQEEEKEEEEILCDRNKRNPNNVLLVINEMKNRLT